MSEIESGVLSNNEEEIEIEIIESETEDYISSPPEYEISTFPADFTLEGLYTKWKAGDIEIPKFQRRFVWKQVQASKLIESFLVGLPVPAIFFYTERKSQKYLVIDGQQRLKSVFYFFEGYFGEEINTKRRIFRLKGMNEKSKWKDQTFNDFDEDDQRKLKNSVLRSFIVNQLDPDDDTSIYHIFERLNTGGTLLTNQEVRNCVYGGKFNDLLIELNHYPSWRSISGKPKPDSRHKDVELILRFLALCDPKKYEKPLKDHLSKFMRHNRTPSSEFLEQTRNKFQETCDAVYNFLGEKPFHIRAGLNSSAYDSVMVAFSKNLDNIPDDVADRYSMLKKDDDFYKYTSRSTTDVRIVLGRLELTEKMLFEE
jgi:hypothetical protein